MENNMVYPNTGYSDNTYWPWPNRSPWWPCPVCDDWWVCPCCGRRKRKYWWGNPFYYSCSCDGSSSAGVKIDSVNLTASFAV